MKKRLFFPGTRAVNRKMRTVMNCVQTQIEVVSDGRTNIFSYMFFTMG